MNRICWTIKKNTDGQNPVGTQSMFVLTVLEKVKETRQGRKHDNLVKTGKL